MASLLLWCLCGIVAGAIASSNSRRVRGTWRRHLALVLMAALWCTAAALAQPAPQQPSPSAVTPLPMGVSTFTGRVLTVLDGRTVDVERYGLPARVRLHGQPTQTSSKALEALVRHQVVTVVVYEVDKKGLLLGEIVLQDGRRVTTLLPQTPEAQECRTVQGKVTCISVPSRGQSAYADHPSGWGFKSNTAPQRQMFTGRVHAVLDYRTMEVDRQGTPVPVRLDVGTPWVTTREDLAALVLNRQVEVCVEAMTPEGTITGEVLFTNGEKVSNRLSSATGDTPAARQYKQQQAEARARQQEEEGRQRQRAEAQARKESEARARMAEEQVQRAIQERAQQEAAARETSAFAPSSSAGTYQCLDADGVTVWRTAPCGVPASSRATSPSVAQLPPSFPPQAKECNLALGGKQCSYDIPGLPGVHLDDVLFTTESWGAAKITGTVRNDSAKPLERLVFTVEWWSFGKAQDTTTSLVVGYDPIRPGGATAVNMVTTGNQARYTDAYYISARWPGQIAPVVLKRVR